VIIRLLKKLGYFLPTLIIVSLVAFFLSKMPSGDPVDHYLPVDSDMPGSEYEVEYYEKQYTKYSKQLHLDLPLFYFALQSTAWPDTFHRIVLPQKKIVLDKLIGQHGNWPAINNYYSALEDLETSFFQLQDYITTNERIDFQHTLGLLKNAYQNKVITNLHQQLEEILASTQQLPNGQQVINLLASPVQQNTAVYQQLINTATPERLRKPTFRWYGTNNQYHHWITGFSTGDFGLSVRDRRPVFDKIVEAAWWTLCINIMSIIIAFGLSIPLGVYMANRAKGEKTGKLNLFLFLLYSIPNFWMAMLLVIFLTTPQYGMNWFASIGLGELSAEAPFWNRFWERLSHLILPVFCMTYGSVAFISRQVRGSMLDVATKDYIRTAFAKGLPRKAVVWRHTFRNALFPLITMIALVFPATLGGSVVVEVIFNIPGMGRLLFDSLLGRDWPVVFMILMIVTILTIVGNLVADILYTMADPRIEVDKI